MKILGSPYLIIFFFVVYALCLYQYWLVLKAYSFKNRLLLFILRSFSVFILLFLLINPWFNFKKFFVAPKSIDVVFDHSESMEYHYKKNNINWISIKDKIENWANSNDINLNIYKLDDKIQLFLEDNVAFSKYTNYSNLIDFILYENPEHLLLITDGKATVGQELTELKFPDDIPIHTLGVGSADKHNDLIIKNVNVPVKSLITDTVRLVVELESILAGNEVSQLQAFNDKSELIYNNNINFKAGNQIKKLDVLIPSTKFNGVNKMIISPLKDEYQVDNNEYDFKVYIEDLKKEIILLSGALSHNTTIIKSCLKQLEVGKVKHYFRINQNKWNKSTLNFFSNSPEMIVLDDFPVSKEDKSLLNKIIKQSNQKQISILYIEGPKSNLTSAELIRANYPELIPRAIDVNTSTSISEESIGVFGLDLSNFPPQKRSVKWTSSVEGIVYYSDGSLLAANSINLFMIAMPSLATTHLKTTINYSSLTNEIINNITLRAFYGNDGLISINLPRNSYDIGEVVKLYPLVANNLELTNLSILSIYEGLDTFYVKCKDKFLNSKYQCDYPIVKSGKYYFQAEAELLDGSIIRSNSINILVQNINIELKDLYMDQIVLQRIAYNTGGYNMSIESLDSMLNSIDITPVKLTKDYQISGLSTQYYWWLLIVFLTAEWFLRKKIGLL